MQFQKNDNLICSIDIGTNSVKIVVVDNAFNKDTKSLYVTSVGKTESRGVRKGVVINIDSTLEAINNALEQAEELLGSKITNAVLSVSGTHLSGINSHGVAKIRYSEVSQDDIERVYESAQAIAIPNDKDILHIIPQEYSVDGEKALKKPIGITGVRLESWIHMVIGSANTIQNVIKCVNRSGVIADNIIASGIASSYSVTSDEERDQGVCTIDIGAGTADLCIYYGGSLRHSAVLSLGGSNVTNDLAAGLRTSLVSAERLKCDYGIACNKAMKAENRIEIPSLGSNVSKIVNQSEVVSIIEDRMTEIFNFLKEEIDKSGLANMLTAGVVLTGGASQMEGVEMLAESVFELPARRGSPQNIAGLSDFVSSPEFSTSAGIIAYSLLGNQEVMYSGRDSTFKKSYKKVSNWIVEHF